MDREIYHWHDGKRDRKSDPIIIARRFHEKLNQLGITYANIRVRLAVADFDCSHLLPKEQAEEQKQKDILDALQATGDQAQVAYFMFGMKPFDEETGEGWTERKASEQLAAFFDWQEQIAGEADGLPTSSASAATQDSPSPTEKSTAST